MEDIQNATLAGGVAVGCSSDLVTGPWSSMLLGSCAGSISCVGFVKLKALWLEKFGLHDSCGVQWLHGVPGCIGCIAGAVAAAQASDSLYGTNVGLIFPARNMGRSAIEQGAYQIYSGLLTLAIAIPTGLLTGLMIKYGCFYK